MCRCCGVDGTSYAYERIYATEVETGCRSFLGVRVNAVVLTARGVTTKVQTLCTEYKLGGTSIERVGGAVKQSKVGVSTKAQTLYT